ncbi:glyoxalase [Croceicoccus estronivorus]|uniref:VOC family protein n=1 Tax=Croceicoccus estronivorus TaxID=1172626 RepID=UPI000832077E|nr:VOC family protein [Croceicoccus estronivorus]OCC25620.1 glyoxalase [Croceicoccus estronivorus]
MSIRSLGYVGFGAPDPAVWLEYATRIIGLMPARACAGEDWGIPMVPGSGPASAGSGVADDGTVYLKMDDWQWRIAIHPDAENRGIKYIGLEVEDQIDLEEQVAKLNEAGFPAELGTQAQAQARSVTGIAFTRDPSGNAIELFYGPVLDRKFASPLGMEFLAGPFGVGHVNLLTSDHLEDAQNFYTRVLGFKLSDYIHFGGGNVANFYACNARHHSVGLLKVGGAIGIHHLMLEVTSVDMVLQCLERVNDAGIAITSTLGRHVNDNMLSFYMRSPFGFEVEIGFDGRLIDKDWTANQFVEGDIWGHRGLDPETIARNIAAMPQT